MAGDSTLDAHPVVRQHFGRRLKEHTPEAFREANRRLYEHYKALPEKLWGKHLPDTLEEMQPLFSAIAHGCAAGLRQEVFDELHYARLYRRDEKFLVHKLGGLSADLGALAHFFDPPWGRPHPSLRAADQAVALNFAGYALCSLGRLREAVQPFRVNLQMRVKSEAWRNAAVSASNLSELLLALGDVGPAVAAVREGVVYADKSGDAFQRMARRAGLADALRQAGDTREVEALFTDAERLQKEDEPEHPWLYSMRGYKFCDLLLGQGQHATVTGRANASRAVVKNLVGIALDTLSLGRAAHQAWRGGQGDKESARHHLDAAVEGLRKAGSEDQIPRGLLARAAFRRDIGEWHKAQEDLAETCEMASRGGMRLFLADYHLERARLLLAQIPGVTPPDEWTLALARAAADAPSAASSEPATSWWQRIVSRRGRRRF